MKGYYTQKIVEEALKILDGKEKKNSCPEFRYGRTVERIVTTPNAQAKVKEE